MTTFNTGNPLGSTDPKDLFDNAEAIDYAVNDTVPNGIFLDRFGAQRKTLYQFQREAQAVVDGAGQTISDATARVFFATADEMVASVGNQDKLALVHSDPNPDYNGQYYSDPPYGWRKTVLQPSSKEITDMLAASVLTAQQTAESGVQKADDAQLTAGLAGEAAELAQGTADEAGLAAGQAQTTADSGLAKADQALSEVATAQTTADLAGSAATIAQETADEAGLLAEAAQLAAASGITKADTAQASADTAKEIGEVAAAAANAAQGTATLAADLAAFSDLKLSGFEYQEIPGWGWLVYGMLNGKAHVIAGMNTETGEMLATNMRIMGDLDAPGVARDYVFDGGWINPTFTEDSDGKKRLISAWDPSGKFWATVDGVFKVISNPSPEPSPETPVKGGLSHLANALYDGLQDVHFVGFGSSTQFGLGGRDADNNPQPNPLTPATAIYRYRSQFNNRRWYFGRYATTTTLTIPEGGVYEPITGFSSRVGNIVDELTTYWEFRTVVDMFRDPSVVVKDIATGAVLEKTATSYSSGPSSEKPLNLLPGQMAEFNLVGTAADIIYGSNPAAAAPFTVEINGAQQYSRAFNAASVTWGNTLSLAMAFRKPNKVTIKNPIGSGAVLRLEPLSRMKRITMTNLGKSGASAASYLPGTANFTQLVSYTTATHYEWLNGGNDRTTKTISRAIEQMRTTLVELMFQTGAQVMVASNHPTLDDFPENTNPVKFFGQQDLYRETARLCESLGISFIDMYTYFLRMKLHGETYTIADGVHLDNPGHLMWADRYMDLLTSARYKGY